jgi:hypothetical protein
MTPAPGTIVREMQAPPPDRPARELQRDPAFQEMVYGISDIIEKLEASARNAHGSS